MKKLFVLFLLFSCTANEPAQQKELLPNSTPEAEGISSKAILDFIEAAEKEQLDAIHSLMIVRHGNIVAEGWWYPYHPDSPHLLYSLSKSFTSTAIGFAVAEELITVDDPVISFFTEKAPEEPSENLKSMRIKDLLRMTTGHATDSYGRIQGHPDGWAAGFLSLPVEHKPGSIFIYNTGATYMLSAILQKVTGQTLVDFLQPRLFDPLEIDKPFWRSDPEGINVGGTGLFVTTKDIAKLGQLYLQKGSWKGEQLLTEEWVQEATSLQTSNGSSPESDWDQGYGYQFWRCRHNLYRGDGAFGQYCIIMPEKDAVIAITSGSGDMQGIMNLVWDYLLPAMKNESLPENEVSLSALTTKLKSLNLSTVEGTESVELTNKVSDKKIVLEANPQGIDSLRLDIDNDDKNLTLWTSEGEQKIPIGYNEMFKGAMKIRGVGNVYTASSGAWTNDYTYQIKMYNYETPHAITYNFRFEENNVEIHSAFNVFFGPTEQPLMKGKLF